MLNTGQAVSVSDYSWTGNVRWHVDRWHVLFLPPDKSSATAPYHFSEITNLTRVIAVSYRCVKRRSASNRKWRTTHSGTYQRHVYVYIYVSVYSFKTVDKSQHWQYRQ